MPINERLRRFLDDNGIRYVVIAHSPAHTAQEVAASAHIKGKSVVKCVMVSGDGKHYLVATTANQKVNLDRFRTALGVREVRVERESDFRRLFDDCEVGAMPPFGNLYGLPVVVDEALCNDVEIAFNGGTHTALVQMSFADFEHLVKPIRAAVADPL